jgi:hypothetical protein
LVVAVPPPLLKARVTPDRGWPPARMVPEMATAGVATKLAVWGVVTLVKG